MNVIPVIPVQTGIYLFDVMHPRMRGDDEKSNN